MEAAKAMGWDVQKSREQMRRYVEDAKAVLERMRRMERGWRKETKAEKTIQEKKKEEAQGDQCGMRRRDRKAMSEHPGGAS